VCGCSRDISLDELCKVFSRQSRKKCEQYLPHINSTCRKYGITTCLRKAHFLAQVGHEPGELRYTAEVLRKGMKEFEVYDVTREEVSYKSPMAGTTKRMVTASVIIFQELNVQSWRNQLGLQIQQDGFGQKVMDKILTA
jgi:hypothetical protein